MNLDDTRYRFQLCREMLAAPRRIREFDPTPLRELALAFEPNRPFLITGEGSSRILPGKLQTAANSRRAIPLVLNTQGATQALEADLTQSVVLGVSNSGHTHELVRLFSRLAQQHHQATIAITSTSTNPLSQYAHAQHILQCGVEQAVPASKSVVEQALVLEAFFDAIRGEPSRSQTPIADAFAGVLSRPIPDEIIRILVGARTVYFTGRDDGVAEELALKAHEITRKRAVFLEGTLALHGIEEVLEPADVCILVDPHPDDIDAYERVLVHGTGASLIAIADRSTRFPTLTIPTTNPLLALAAGWSLLVETGIIEGLDLDRPRRARKIGNPVAHIET